MVSISDLGKPDPHKEIPDAPETRAKTPDEWVATLEPDRLAQIAAMLSAQAPTTLGSYDSGKRPMVVEVPPNPAIALLREQTAHARRVMELANRPWWKTSGAWAVVISLCAFALPLITEHPAQLLPDAWLALKSFIASYIH